MNNLFLFLGGNLIEDDNDLDIMNLPVDIIANNSGCEQAANEETQVYANFLIEDMVTISPGLELLDISMSDVVDAENVASEEILDDPTYIAQEIENTEEVNNETLEEIENETFMEINNETLVEETSSASTQYQTNNSGPGNTPRATQNAKPVEDTDTEEIIVLEKKRKKHNSVSWKKNVNKKLRLT